MYMELDQPERRWRVDHAHDAVPAPGLASPGNTLTRNFDRRRTPYSVTMRYHGSQQDLPPEDRLADLRRRIAEGSYDSPERLAAAVSLMFDQEFVENPEEPGS